MSNPPPSYDERPDEGTPRQSTGRRRPNATPEQLAARRQLAEARAQSLDRKKRTRQLIEVGGVLASYGIDTPQQAEELMRALVSPERPGSRRFLLDTLKARQTGRWPGR